MRLFRQNIHIRKAFSYCVFAAFAIGVFTSCGKKNDIRDLDGGTVTDEGTVPIEGETPEELFTTADMEIKNALDESNNITQPYSELTVSEQISYQIVSQVKVNLIKDSDKSATVEISYPDVAGLLSNLYDGDNSADKIEQIYAAVLEQLENGTVEIKTITAEVEYNDDHSGIVWSEEIIDAMSGGMYSLINAGE